MSYHFHKKESIAQGIRRMVLEQLDKALGEAQEPRVLKTEKIHRVRKRVKKIRSLLRLARPAIGSLYVSENKAFQRIGRNLSPYRDADVLIATLKGLPPMPTVKKDLQAQRLLKTRQRDSALAWAVKELDAARTRVNEWELPEMNDQTILNGLERILSRLHKAYEGAFSSGDEEHFHELRKLVKHHGLHSHTLSRPWPDHLKSYKNLMENMGEWLGQDHDLAVLSGHLRKKKAYSSKTKDAIVKRQKALREQVQASGRLLLAEKPARFVKRMKKYLAAWREE